jgi:hypothetical protein
VRQITCILSLNTLYAIFEDSHSLSASQIQLTVLICEFFNLSIQIVDCFKLLSAGIIESAELFVKDQRDFERGQLFISDGIQ